MKQLLSIEYTKLKKLNSLKILLLCYIVIVPLLIFAFDSFLRQSPEIAMLLGGGNFFQFPLIWKLTAFSASFVNVLLCVTVVIITCNEIYFKTMRQNVIDGLSKSQVIWGKFVIVVLLSLFVTLYTFLVGFIFGIFNGGSDHIWDGIDLIFRYFLQTMGYFSFAFLFALLIKKPALAIILFISYFPVETIIKLFSGESISQFFPLQSLADMTPMPFLGIFARAQNTGGVEAWTMSLQMHYAVVLVYIALFFSFSYYLLRKRDL